MLFFLFFLFISTLDYVTSNVDSIRLVFISDTHSMHHEMPPIPKGDILVHTGDFSNVGDKSDLISFKQWFESQPHALKIFIAGNHELSLETSQFVREGFQRSRVASVMSESERENYSVECRRIISEEPSIYLEDKHCDVSYFDKDNNPTTVIRFYGSPHQPEFYSWAFNLDKFDGSLERKWAQIPDNTDILLTHGPPFGILDWDINNKPCGCPHLLNEVKTRVKPRIHAFGHLHDGYGTMYDGTTLFVNSCTCTEHYRPINRPIVVDLPVDRTLPPIVVPFEQQEFENM